MNEVFAAIAKQENGEFKVTDAKYDGAVAAQDFHLKLLNLLCILLDAYIHEKSYTLSFLSEHISCL
ncbi:hypothetical protein E0W68_03925 [Flavobacterium salilacus subsp. salilacus]|uniref:hypothetical protein n=1 Tax=Flavobacterium TaxID=237 RepID=UPI00107521E3|nr:MULTISPECIES: hypothetical protein [Flavobacterium]KAF2519504.1 hypothetical protein E0W68_03925 [Flavobacterium salilacus subsp. salilacus]MBE1614598.1 hypothetical protein [Flavobacterium sp. SaA2.13]